MVRALASLTLLLACLCCKEDSIGPSSLECYHEFKGLRRGQYVVDAPVVVQLAGGLIVGSQMMPKNGVPWGACNLPGQFVKDSLAIYVTGYFLTSEDLELMNVIPLPFEVTSAKLR